MKIRTIRYKEDETIQVFVTHDLKKKASLEVTIIPGQDATIRPVEYTDTPTIHNYREAIQVAEKAIQALTTIQQINEA